MAGRDWHGIPVPDGIGDDVLERLYSIQGIEIYQVRPEGLVFSTYPHTQNDPTTDEVKDAFSSVATVTSGTVFFATFFSVVLPPETSRENLASWAMMPWWNAVIERLRNFAASRNTPPPTLLDFEKDILLGVSFVLMENREQSAYDNRDASTAPSYFEEAARLLEAMSHLNQKSVYDLYLDHLESFDGINNQHLRIEFGEIIAWHAIGKRKLRKTPKPIFGIQIPTWWSTIPGTFNVCVSKSRENEFGPVLCTLVIEHHEFGINSSTIIYDNAPEYLVNKCLKMNFSKESEMLKFVNNSKDAGRRLFCKSMQGEDIVDFVIALCPKQYASVVRSQVEEVLAYCFSNI